MALVVLRALRAGTLSMILRSASAAAASDPAGLSPATSTALQECSGPAENAASCLLQREGHVLAAARGQVAAQAKAGVQPGQKAKAQPQKSQRAHSPGPDASVTTASPKSDKPGLDHTSLQSFGREQHEPSDKTGFDHTSLQSLGSEQREASVPEPRRFGPPRKSKVVLMLIDMFPPAWLLGIDRVYLGSIRSGLAKLLLGFLTFGVGSVIWGLIDLIAVLVNAFQSKERIHTLGMAAQFEHGQVHTAFVLGIVDLVMLPVWIGGLRLLWWVRRKQSMDRLKQAALNSPHFNFKKQASSSTAASSSGS